MSRLAGIPIRIEGAPHADPPASLTGTIGGGVRALLTEIATHLERVASGGEAFAIDLRTLPMSPEDLAQLSAALGHGEVEITLHAGGESIIRETAVHGVWWAEHRDRDGAVIASFIEIATAPQILLVDADELQQGAAQLRIALRAPPVGPKEKLDART
ncbi:MAG TPA: hydrogenase expression/formation C-terminal domain-containing protein [Steroidobacteraceae bacterium]|nr:hydrogenase expression/formation C-terminal domain-containing protein [Steroidobacteraceae bacterium]